MGRGGRCAGRETGGRVKAAAVQAACWEGPTVEDECSARAERTVNMTAIFVTLDVSKLSGWLNADAYCRVKRKHKRADVRVERREGVGAAAAAHAAC